MLGRNRVPGVASSTPSRPDLRSRAGRSCGYRFKNPSLGKTLMINQAADPSAAAASSSGRAGGAGGRGCGGSGAERSGLPRKGRVPQSEAAGWACARFPQPGLGRSRAGAGTGPDRVPRAKGQQPQPGSQAAPGRGRRARGLRSSEPRCEAAAPPPARARTMGAPLAVALGALHYLALFLQLGGATRPAGHAPWDNHISGHGELGRRPRGLPHQTPPWAARLRLGGPRTRARGAGGGSPRGGAPCRVCGPALAPWPLLRTRVHPGCHPHATLAEGSFPTLYTRVDTYTFTTSHGHTATLAAFSHNSYPHTSPDTFSDRPHFCAHYTHSRRSRRAHTLPAGTPEHNSCLPAFLQTHWQNTHTCEHTLLTHPSLPICLSPLWV